MRNDVPGPGASLRTTSQRLLYNQAPCGYHSLDRDGTIVQINDTELTWLGYTRDEVVGRLNFQDILTAHSRQLFQQQFSNFKEKGWISDLEYDLIRKDGTRLPVLLSATAIRDETGNYLISLELHDTAAQELASLKIGLENLRDNPGAMPAAQGSSQFTNLLGILQQSLNSIRTLSYNLRPPDLRHLGLVQAIRRQCEEVAARTGPSIDFKAAGLEGTPLAYEVAINLYRIVQEGLTNVWRHAQAKKVSIKLVASYPKIILRLEDDGQGFDVAAKVARNQPARRLGLLGMKERVAFLGGDMQLASQLTKGTRIKIEIPWSGEDHGPKEKDSSG